MNVRIINLANGTINVHAADCADTVKDEHLADRRGGWAYTLDAACALDVSRDVFADHIAEGSVTAKEALRELTFKPCCKFPLPR